MQHYTNGSPYHQRGVFKLRQELLVTNFPLVKKMMADLVVIRAENNFADDTITYHACGPCFDWVDPGHMTPEYDLAYIVHGDVISYAFIRKD